MVSHQEAKRKRINIHRLLNKCQTLSAQADLERDKKKTLLQYLTVLKQWNEEIADFIEQQEKVLRRKPDHLGKDASSSDHPHDMTEFKVSHSEHSQQIDNLFSALAANRPAFASGRASTIEDRRRDSLYKHAATEKMRAELFSDTEEDEQQEEEYLLPMDGGDDDDDDDETWNRGDDVDATPSSRMEAFRKKDDEEREAIRAQLLRNPRRQSSIRNRFRRREWFDDDDDDGDEGTGMKEEYTGKALEEAIDSEREKHQSISNDIMELTAALKHNTLRMDAVIKKDLQELDTIDEHVNKNIESVTKESAAIAKLRASTGGGFLCILLLLVIVAVVFIWMVMMMRFSPI